MTNEFADIARAMQFNLQDEIGDLQESKSSAETVNIYRSTSDTTVCTDTVEVTLRNIGEGFTWDSDRWNYAEWGETFDNVYDVVEDLSADDTGNTAVNSVLDANKGDNTLFLFPPGDYLIDEFEASGYRNFGIICADGVTFTPVDSGASQLFQFRDARDYYIEGINVDISNSGQTSQFVIRAIGGNNIVKDYTLIGEYDVDTAQAVFAYCENSTTRLTFENLQLAYGGVTAGVFVGPTLDGPLPEDENEVVSLLPAGTIEFLNCDLRDWKENLYASAHSGILRVIGGQYHNGDLGAVRVGGPSALVKDVDIYVTDSELSNHRSIWLKEGDNCVIENVDIYAQSCGYGNGIVQGTEAGKMTIRNTRIAIECDDFRAIRGRPNVGWPYRAPSMDTAPQSLALICDRVHINDISGYTFDETIELIERPDTLFVDCCIHNPHRPAFAGRDNTNAEIIDSTITGTQGSTGVISTTNISAVGPCDLPDNS